ncbi:PIN domain-containing protein [Hymenobacter aerophilus]|uniref:PIN domain-containing protein n=1 Tax=Hymenobacter aerophilus TaxID=119644 RepID=UPI0003795E15|nr:PIN domain-containing protein [Hymenobacter aerophilus]
MSFDISDIRTVEPALGRLYFFDANVWFYIIEGAPTPDAKPYLEFWAKLTELSDGTTPVIVATSLLIAETLNAYLQAGFRVHKKEQERTGADTRGWTFKDNYRGTAHFRQQRDNFTYQFIAYQDYISIVSDSVDEVDVWQMLERIPAIADFNDFYYVRFCQHHQHTIVTHDKDFRFEGVPILTANRHLLRLTNQ